MRNMFKIVYYHRCDGTGAPGVHVMEIINALKKLGHNVTEVSLTNITKINQEINPKKSWLLYKLERFKRKFIWLYEILSICYNFPGYFHMMRKCSEIKPDFIYERYALCNLTGILAAKRLKIPIIMEVNAPLIREQKQYEKLYFKKLTQAIETYVFNNADAIVVVTNVLKNILIEEGVEQSKITVISNGVNLDAFNIASSGKDIRVRYGLEDNIVLGFVGVVRKYHGLEILFNILPELIKKEPKLHFMLVGYSQEIGAFEDYLAEIGQSKNVTITGNVAHKSMAEYIAAMDIALMPDSNVWGSPMKIFEYMAMGKAVVAPKLASIEEINTDNHDAVLFTQGNAQHLQDAILKLATNKDIRNKIGSNARQTIIVNDITWDRNARMVIDIFRVLYERSTRKQEY